MRVIFIAVLLVGLGLAGFAVHMAQGYIQQYQTALANERAAHKPPIETVDVVVTNAQLRYGVPLTKKHVKVVKWPKAALPEGVFQSVEALFPENDPRKRYVIRAMEPNEALMTVKVSDLGQDAGLVSRLKRGERAFTINVNVATGVSGFLRPGDSVDVYWTGQVGGRDGDVSKLIQSNMQLIAIDQSVDQDRDKASIARTVTVAVQPDEVAALALAQSTGNLSLSLVGAGDDTVAQSIEINQRTLLGLPEEEAPEVVAKREIKKVCTIKNRRGAEVVEIQIPCTN